MSKLSLKIRLILVLSAMVLLIGSVGVNSFLTQRGIQSEVAVFSTHRKLDLREFDLRNNRLELEGSWDPAGVFIAKEVEVFPGRRRPKLRGSIQSIDHERRELVMYGQRITLSKKTNTSELSQGQRIEITCKVKDGQWIADEVNFKNIKSSDKIKACATDWDLDGRAPETLNIDGIQISLITKSEPEVSSALLDIETATALSLCIFELRAQAYTLAEASSSSNRDPGGLDVEGDASFEKDAEAQLRAARKEFEHNLSRAGGEVGQATPNRWIAALFDQLGELDSRLERFLSAADGSRSAGRSQLRTSLIPFLDREIESRLNVYLREAQNDLGDRARRLEERTRSTTRTAFAICILATVIATLLGYLLLRSIRRPLNALVMAAQKISAGDLTARVEVHSPDELGALASAFNQMSESLALTTVSIDNLQNILDSMSGTLILLTPERQIISLNQAAAKLLSIEPDSMVGAPFSKLCASGSDARLFSQGAPSADVSEMALLSSAGQEVLVSFSAAELRSGDGSLRGYVCVAQDLSDQKRIEKEVRTSLQEKEVLLREVHHRVKNNMQVISSLLAMQQGCSTDDSVVHCLEQCQARIRSMALIHEHLYQSSDLAQADVSAYLSLLVAHITQSFGSNRAIALDQNFEQLSMGLDQALALGLIVNELLSNSYQHAFQERAEGRIQLSLQRTPGEQVELIVADDGWGIDPGRAVPELGTLGLSLIQTLVAQLGGQSSVSQEHGLSTCITFPYKPYQRTAE